MPGTRWCAGHSRAAAVEETGRREQLDAVRGYTSRWTNYARAFRQRFPISPGYLVRSVFWTPTLARQFHALRCLAVERAEFGSFFTGAGAEWLGQFPIYVFHPSRTVEHAQEVDHIIPVSGPADPLFWEEWNHQALSKRQHSEKTATHDGGFRGRMRAPTAPRVMEGGMV